MHQFSGFSILVLGCFCVRIKFSPLYKFTNLISVPYVILSISLLKVSATLCIVTIRIRSRREECTGCPWGDLVWITERRQSTEFMLCNDDHSGSSQIMSEYMFSAIFTHSTIVFPHKIESSKPTTSFSVSNLHIIATATEVNVLPRPISSATRAHVTSESQTHLHTMKNLTQTWSARNVVVGMPGTEYCCQGLGLHWIGLSDWHSVGGLPQYDFHIWIHCWVMNCYPLNQGLPHHPPLAPIPLLHHC